jgi:protein involved in polysaccharide export with SLBB domain
VPVSSEVTVTSGRQAEPQGKPSDMTEDMERKIRQPAQPSGPEQPRLRTLPLTESPETLSKFEQFITGNGPAAVSTNIRQFGYELFRRPPSTFAPVTNVPVSAGYVLGPGDEVRINVWGKVEGIWNPVVDRDGNISLPKAGIIGVTGLTFAELKNLLHKEFSKYYTGFEMNVSMGSLRTIRVYVVGNAVRPGSYTISSLSTLINALFEAGGPSKTGTMRNIQVKRKGQIIEAFDMYDFLLRGDKTKDIRLMPEDVIFIPSVGPLTGIAGNVKQPAIFEMRGETRLLDLINMAGGLTSTAFKGRVQVQRTENFQFRTLFEGDLLDIENNRDKNFILDDGDLVKVFSVSDTKNTVKLAGAVANAGEYAIHPGITRLSDVIYKAGGLMYFASDQAELTRIRVTQAGPETEMLNIDILKALNGSPEHNISLEINDYLFVRSIPEWRLYQTVNISGEVKFPGTYTIKKGETFSSLIARAGGYTDRAYLRGAVFTRNSVRELQQKGLVKMIERLERDLISTGISHVSTSLSGEEMAAQKAELEQQKDFINSLKKLKATGRMSIRLVHLRLLKGSQYDIELEQGDNLFIPLKNSVVNVLGSVMSRGSFVYSDTLDYKNYIAMAGGYTKFADEDEAYVLKVDGTAMKLSNGAVNWNVPDSRWEMTAFSDEIKELEPGDTIVIPDKLDRIAWLKEAKDLTQILYQIAVTAGVAITVF